MTVASKKGQYSAKGDQRNENLLAFLEVENARVESALHSVEEGDVVSFVEKKGGKVTKSELYEWAKGKGLTPVALYKVLARLVGEKVLRKEFDEEAEELVYVLVQR